MILFENDYQEGAHPQILERFVQTNLIQTIGYSCDRYCDAARKIIRNICKAPNSAVHFFVGGTQTTTTVIANVLRPHQGVLAAETGHINVHESGAIENTGHKVLALPTADGKLTAQQIQTAYDNHWNDETHEHMVQPGMVYISFPTENGTLYTKKELEEISSTCKACNLILYVDGARMGYGIMAANNDVTLADFTRLTDFFYIGGTKVGALFGEALLINNPQYKEDFRYQIKQRGGLLAKGRVLGLQFLTLFENGLYFDIAQHANIQAMRLKKAFVAQGYSLLYDSFTNQQFPILSENQYKVLGEHYLFSHWCKTDEHHTAVRFCTSWATKSKDVDTLIKDLEKVANT